MNLIESVLGNCNDEEWKSRLAPLRIDEFRLDQWEAQKNRLRKKTIGGTERAVALPRLYQLRDGDVLACSDTDAIVVRITLKEVMVIDLAGAAALSPDAIARSCFELGHALGNQHWPAVVKDTHVYVPLTVDRKVMDSVMRTHRFEHVTYSFQPGASVIPYLAPHEARRLFGGADATPHSHAQAYQAAPAAPPAPAVPAAAAPHDHEHEHAHPHVHEDGTTHVHPHAHVHQHPHASAPRGVHQHVELHGSFAAHDHDHSSEQGR